MKELAKRIGKLIRKRKVWFIAGFGSLFLIAVADFEPFFGFTFLIYLCFLSCLLTSQIWSWLRLKYSKPNTKSNWFNQLEYSVTSVRKWIWRNKRWFFTGLGGFVLIFFKEYDSFFSFGLLFFFSFLFYLAVSDIRSLIRLKHEKSKTELLHLQSQVNPHFFFNMLNNLYGLVEQNPKKAQSVILGLSDMMRYSIYDGQKEWVTLEQEVTYLKNHIELHKMRYHKKVHTQFHVEIDEEHTIVMPLLFIILLENAFKHGVEKLRADAFVSVSLISEGKSICFEVENNFDLTDESIVGIGLENLRRRLDLVYPRKYKLTVSVSENVYRTQLMLMP
jgi:two-component system sensor histidine kinase AlgZ